MCYEARIGARAERAAARFLRRRGLRSVRSNHRAKVGELDLVMRDGDVLVFVEVRYRADTEFMTPEQSIDARKQRRLIKAANHFLATSWRGHAPRCRFDVVSVTRRHYRFDCRWTKDAFHS